MHRIPQIPSSPPIPRTVVSNYLLLFLLPAIAAFLSIGAFFDPSNFQPALVNYRNRSKTTADLANDFYQHHFHQMQALVNESSVVSLFPWLDAFQNDILQKNESLFKVENFSDPDIYRHSRYIYWQDLCKAATMFHKHKETHPEMQVPHVLIAEYNENWGAFSEYIPNRTVNWVVNLTSFWQDKGCSKQVIMDYIEHPNTKAIVTSQFQNINHPKVTSIPLGIKVEKGEISSLMAVLNQEPPSTPNNITGNRSQLLLINSSPWENRQPIYEAVIRNFADNGIELENLYGGTYDSYLVQLRHAKFILSPSGLGFDCYRHWEAILMGTIPVIEHLNRTIKDGMFRNFDGLPVAWIDSYDNLTPQWLEQEYHRIVSQSTSYQYEKLTLKYWIDLIQSSLQ